MLVDKVPWIRHDEGGPIFSIDVHPTLQKLATCGQDNKIRVWNLLPVLHERHERDPEVPKLLASLENHVGAVNVVRFSHNGQFLASGSDDKLVCICKLHAGQGRVAFGSNEAPSLENWRQVQALRGHDMNVVDLAWSPDDQFVATASLDNLVMIWEVSTGRRVTVLSGHKGFVKGVAWDPFNAFVATQGENDGVFIWRVSDWTLVKKVQEHLGEAQGVAFHSRLGWSPDGQILAVTNGFESPAHISPLINRNTWTSGHSFVGHKGPVLVVRYNPKFFYPRSSPESDEVVTLAAIGSLDKNFSVWSPKEKEPLCVGRKLFKKFIMDVAWTPDGYSLLVASYDGTVAVMRFEEKELGRVVPDNKVQELISALYGKPNVRLGNTLAESAEVLMLERAAAAADNCLSRAPSSASQSIPPAPAAARQPTQPPLAGAVCQLPLAGPVSQLSLAGAVGQLPPQLSGVGVAPGVMSKLSSRLGPGGAGLGAAGGSGAADGGVGTKRRMQPTTVDTSASGRQLSTVTTNTATAPAGATATHAAAAAAAKGTRSPQQPSKRQATAVPAAPAAAPAAAARAMQPPPQKRVVVGQDDAGSMHHTAAVAIQPPPITQKVFVRLGKRPPALFGDEGEEGGTLSLEAANNVGRDARGKPYAELVCSCSGRPLWLDRLQGGVIIAQMAGTLHFSAVSTSSGDLQIYSAAGRRLFPSIQLGCRTAFMHAASAPSPHVNQDERTTDWLLLVVTTDGCLRLWDLERPACVLETSVAPLLTQPKIEVTAVRFSSTGCPLVVLSNCHAHAYHKDMKCWMRVADDSLPASVHHSSFLEPAAAGDLARLQQEASSQLQPEYVLSAALDTLQAWQLQQGRAHLEINMAAAQALGSPAEWKRWLITYVRQLSADADEVRLREVVDNLLGPIRWSPSTHPSTATGGWQPTMMGLDKRKILRNEVLKEVARNRANQRLLHEVMDMLKEVDQGCEMVP